MEELQNAHAGSTALELDNCLNKSWLQRGTLAILMMDDDDDDGGGDNDDG